MVTRTRTRYRGDQTPPTTTYTVLVVGFLFLYSACPDAGVQISNFQYNVFEDSKCRLQWLGVVQSLASLAASFAYSATLSDRAPTLALAVTSMLAGVLGLSALPFVTMRSPKTHLDQAFALAAVSSVIQGFFGQLAMVPLLVLATEACPTGAVGTIYGAMLCVLEFGAVVSGLATEPIVAALGITFEDWTQLPSLLYIAAGSKMFVMAFIAVLAVFRTSRLKPDDGYRPLSGDAPFVSAAEPINVARD